MSGIIYKPYSVINEEWSELCNRFIEVRDNLYKTQNPMLEEYPSDETWNEYLKAKESYESVREEMDKYRETVFPST